MKVRQVQVNASKRSQHIYERCCHLNEKFKEDQGCILSRNIRAQFDFLKCHLDPISENSPYVIY